MPIQKAMQGLTAVVGSGEAGPQHARVSATGIVFVVRSTHLLGAAPSGSPRLRSATRATVAAGLLGLLRSGAVLDRD